MINDLTGNRYGMLTVLGESEVKRGKNGKTHRFWKCRCDCGKELFVRGVNLTYGTTKSCGCMRVSGKRIKHGMSDSRLYRIYYHIVQRCTNPNNARYKDYGGRGISVCEEWLKNKELFFEWSLKNGYSDNLTIDRKDVNGDYCPENCRWITNEEQQLNKRNTVTCSVFGKEMVSSVAADSFGIDRKTFLQRVDKGLKDEELIKKPTRRTVMYNGKKYNLRELSKILNINYNTLQSRANRKLSDEEMVAPVHKRIERKED